MDTRQLFKNNTTHLKYIIIQPEITKPLSKSPRFDLALWAWFTFCNLGCIEVQMCHNNDESDSSISVLSNWEISWCTCFWSWNMHQWINNRRCSKTLHVSWLTDLAEYWQSPQKPTNHVPLPMRSPFGLVEMLFILPVGRVRHRIDTSSSRGEGTTFTQP